MSDGYFLFWFVQFCIGALVGATATKSRVSLRAGLAITLLLGTVAIVELIVVDELQHNRRPGNIIGYVIGAMVLAHALWGICLLFACLGYWLALWTLPRIGLGGWQFGIPTALVIVALYCVVAAIART